MPPDVDARPRSGNSSSVRRQFRGEGPRCLPRAAACAARGRTTEIRVSCASGRARSTAAEPRARTRAVTILSHPAPPGLLRRLRRGKSGLSGMTSCQTATPEAANFVSPVKTAGSRPSARAAGSLWTTPRSSIMARAPRSRSMVSAPDACRESKHDGDQPMRLGLAPFAALDDVLFRASQRPR